MQNLLGIAPRGPGLNVIELDRMACERDAPFGIITADCSNPHEFDDGIAIEPLPAECELYRVYVFSADTSRLYLNEDIVRQVIRRTESRYENTGTELEAYEPMLPEHQIRRHHFAEGTERSALAISFIVGVQQPPTEFSVGFGNVSVNHNLRYDEFGKLCGSNQNFEPYGRAAALILHHLAPKSVADPESAYLALTNSKKETAFKKGSDINQILMVSANHVVGQLVKDELAIFRTHDTQDDSFAEVMSPLLARFSSTPSKHEALGLDVYTRVTSPLRRAEDFIMLGLLRARQEHRPTTSRDRKLVAATVQKLNQRIVSAAFSGRLTLRDEDFWVRPTPGFNNGSGFATKILSS